MVPRLLPPLLFSDDRGFFRVVARNDELPVAMVQTNLSRSLPGVLRGLHYQLEHSQAKLITVLQGAILDVAVDVRRSSPDFGRCYTAELSAENGQQFFIPAGYAHGFCVLGQTPADVLYHCSDYHHAGDDYGIHWNDPALAVPWPLQSPVVSAKDQVHPRLAEVPPEHLPC